MACDGDVGRLARFAGRFARPCHPTLPLDVQLFDAGWSRDGLAAVVFEAVSDGVTVIKHGRAEIRPGWRSRSDTSRSGDRPITAGQPSGFEPLDDNEVDVGDGLEQFDRRIHGLIVSACAVLIVGLCLSTLESGTVGARPASSSKDQWTIAPMPGPSLERAVVDVSGATSDGRHVWVTTRGGTSLDRPRTRSGKARME